jgi:ribose transport system permease protein
MADPPPPTTAVPAVDEQSRVERAAREAGQAAKPLSRLLDSAPARNLGLVAVLVLLGVVGASTADTFLTRSNLLTILTSA